MPFFTLLYKNGMLDANLQVLVPYHNSFIYCYHFKLLFVISCNVTFALPVSG